MFWTIFFASLLMGFSGAVMPGPLLTVTIKETLNRGFIAGPLLVLGHAILELALVLLILLGLGSVINFPYVKGAIGLIGGLFLCWMAFGILKQAGNASLDFKAEKEKSSNPLFAGIVVSASNPYWSLWWVTAGASSLLLAADRGSMGVVSFYTGHILSDFTWYSLVSAAVAGGRKLFTPLIYKIILLICGIFLLGLALFFIYSGIKFVV